MAKFNKLEGDLAVEYVPIDSIQPNAYNNNVQHPDEFELLQKSMRADGFTQPILVQKNGRTIVDGEHRWRAAKSIGYTQVPVVWTDMTPEQMRISTLRHNRARGTEDANLAAQVLRDLVETVDVEDLAAELSLDLENLRADLDMTMPAITAEDLVDGLDTAKDNGIPAEISDLLRRKEAEMSERATAQHSESRSLESAYYFVSFVFSQDEGVLVQSVLDEFGSTKPEGFLAFCRKILAEGW